jgi:anti-anti-sigma regulatory factor
MLKITKIEERVGDVLLKLEGKIMEQWAALLDGECRSYIRKKKVVYLDCSNVEYIDARGVEVVNKLPRKHVTVLSAPSVVQELLQSGGRS